MGPHILAKEKRYYEDIIMINMFKTLLVSHLIWDCGTPGGDLQIKVSAVENAPCT
jgi:hypothetical protein